MVYLNLKRAAVLMTALLLGASGAWAASPSNIVVIGATAQSAPEIIKQALAQGRKVTALRAAPKRLQAQVKRT